MSIWFWRFVITEATMSDDYVSKWCKSDRIRAFSAGEDIEKKKRQE